MAVVYTVERIDAGVELRLAQNHTMRCRLWMCDEVALSLLGQLTDATEARLRAQMPEEYDRALSRLIALMRAVMDGQPGGTIELPDGYAAFLPFLN